MKYYYHATSYENWESIFNDYEIKQSMEGGVFVSDTPESAIAFVRVGMLRGNADDGNIEKVVVLTIGVSESSGLIVEPTEHSNAYLIVGDVSYDYVVGDMMYALLPDGAAVSYPEIRKLVEKQKNAQVCN